MKTIPARNDLGRVVTEEVRDEAIAKGLERSQWEPHAVSVQYLADRGAIALEFDDSSAITLPIGNYPYLRDLSREELSRLRVGFGGVALCLEERDLHVSIAGLVAASRSLTEVAVAVAAKAPVWKMDELSFDEIRGLALDLNRLEYSTVITDKLAIAVSQIADYLVGQEQMKVEYWTSELDVPEYMLVDALALRRQADRDDDESDDQDVSDDDVMEDNYRPA
jgi:hypothetical protein